MVLTYQDVQPTKELERVVIRFAGDSGDGMQLTGNRFGVESARLGNDIVTLPDYPAEIRAPRGTIGGVSSFQLQFASTDISTPGETVDALVAMNPAALKKSFDLVKRGGLVIVDKSEFTARNIKNAGYNADPRTDGLLANYQLVEVDITSLTRGAVEQFELGRKGADRCRNMFALGLVNWLYSRPNEPTEAWLEEKFSKNPAVRDANVAALRAGHAYGETVEAFAVRYRVEQADLPPGRYRQVSGTQALALGLLAAANKSGRQLFFSAYPITPASDLLADMSKRKAQGVMTFQAEDEIAAAGAALGASYGGALGVTSTSGPGFVLKQEVVNLAVMTELPLVIVDVMRAGPSTGMPTKTEQSDLLDAMWGRSGESPLPVFAARTPSDCFRAAFQACKVALEARTPVVLLVDAYLANGTQPWRYPSPADLPSIEPNFATENNNQDKKFLPYLRDEKLARAWALPGVAGTEHRIGGIEKDHETGDISYAPANHDEMVRTRAEKIARIEVPDAYVDDPDGADVAVVGWGSTWGAIATAVEIVRARAGKIAHIHLDSLNPLPANLGDVLHSYKKVVVAEVNLGQLCMILRAKYLVAAENYNRVRGLPLAASELSDFLLEKCEASNE